MRKAPWLVPAAAIAVAGCFNEPEPAYKTVPAENRIYLSDRSLTALPELLPVLPETTGSEPEYKPKHFQNQKLKIKQIFN